MSYDISIWEEMKDKEFAEREKKRKELLTLAVESLKRYFLSKKVKRVFLIGSVLKKGDFYDFSDIDIAVEGLGEDYFLTLSELEAMLERDVDLIELENYRLKEEVEKIGMRIK